MWLCSQSIPKEAVTAIERWDGLRVPRPEELAGLTAAKSGLWAVGSHLSQEPFGEGLAAEARGLVENLPAEAEEVTVDLNTGALEAGGPEASFSPGSSDPGSECDWEADSGEEKPYALAPQNEEGATTAAPSSGAKPEPTKEEAVGPLETAADDKAACAVEPTLRTGPLFRRPFLGRKARLGPKDPLWQGSKSLLRPGPRAVRGCWPRQTSKRVERRQSPGPSLCTAQSWMGR